MNILIIEASTERAAVGLIQGGSLTLQRQLPYGLEQSKHLMPSIAELLNEADLPPKNLDAIAIGSGPGSYTGIRMAAAIAKTLAYTCSLPLISFCSLEAFIPRQEGAFAAVIDAKIAGAYVLKGEKRGSTLLYFDKPQVLPVEELGSYLENTPLLLTPNKKKIEARFHEAFPSKEWTWEESPPDLLHLAAIALEKYEKQHWTLGGELPLLYLRGKGAKW